MARHCLLFCFFFLLFFGISAAEGQIEFLAQLLLLLLSAVTANFLPYVRT